MQRQWRREIRKIHGRKTFKNPNFKKPEGQTVEEPSRKPPTEFEKKGFKLQMDVRREKLSPSEVKRRQQDLEEKLEADKVDATTKEEKERLADVVAAEKAAKMAEEKLKAQTKAQ
ncbi:hypothetical protein L1887_36605 [Cichorium endivia]|nr:hypothetical protein L1887_36605 [Cichorium endivia]